MIVEIKVPSPGESITEVEIASWNVENGDFVEKDQEIAEIESDKATLSLIAEADGKINILAEAGDSIAVGAVACTIDADANGTPAPKKEKEEVKETVAETPKEEKKVETKLVTSTEEYKQVKVTPVAKEMMKEQGVNLDDIMNGLQRLGKNEVEQALQTPKSTPVAQSVERENSREIQRNKMSSLRKKLSKRLVSVKNETAMLTTFNEVDMSAVMEMRKKYQKLFVDKHGIKLGFMSFFTKAVAVALQKFPAVNSQIDGEEILVPEFVDVAIAVQAPKGLMVPVVRNVENMGLADIELKIADLAARARNNKISLEEMTGGTFTITNGGVFGSMMSTPILNPPQSGILGMHNILERPVAVNGKVEIRPMMYIALSYDHRVIDGKDSVGFLVKIKELIENPHLLLFEGNEPEKQLLGL